MTATQTDRLAPHRYREYPLGLFIAYLRENQSLPENAQKRGFKAMLREEGYEDFVDAIVDQWMSLNYSNALQATKPPSVREISETVRRRKAERDQQEREAATRTETAKALIGSRLLDLTTPNGKRLRDCTGAECVAIGGFYARIGKKVGPRQLVGKALSNEGIAALLK